MVRGWFVGDFEPSAFRTKNFEVGLLSHKKDEKWPEHFHLKAAEINCLISGKMKIKGTEINSGDIFVLEQGEVADPEFLEDCSLIVVKTISDVKDKYEIQHFQGLS